MTTANPSDKGGDSVVRRLRPSDAAAGAWLRQHGADTFGSTDFLGGVVAGVLVAAYLIRRPAAVDGRSLTILAGVAALGVALLAVVLTAMAILGGFNRDYQRVLTLVDDEGPTGALAPYQTVAVVCALTTLLAFAGLVLGPDFPNLWRAIGSGVIALFAFWSTWGTVQLVNLTAFHSKMQSKQRAALDKADRILREKKQG